MLKTNHSSGLCAVLTCLLVITNFTNNSAQNISIDTSEYYFQWEDYELAGPKSKIIPSTWFKWWYAPVAAGIPTSLIFLLSDEEEIILPPTINCPSDLTLNCDREVPPPDFSGIVYTNNCPDGDASVTHSSDISNNGTGCDGNPLVIIRTYTVTDKCGNQVSCTQSFTYSVDNESPTLVCPSDIELQCLEDIPDPDLTTLTAGDNCTPDEELIITHSNDLDNDGSFCIDNPRVVSRTYEVQDLCGNTNSCVQNISYTIDQEPPSISCPEDIELQCLEDIPDPDITTLTAGDNCTSDEELIITHSNDLDNDGSFCLDNPRSIIRTYEVQDLCGNTNSCVQNISYTIDQEPPSISCPEDITIQWGSDIPSPNISAVTSSDNCSSEEELIIQHKEDNDNNGQLCIINPRIITRTFTVQDACNNQSSCNQVISFTIDDIAPVLTCPADITIECDESIFPSETGEVIASDNYTSVSDIEINYLDNDAGLTDCNGTGNIIREFSASDLCDNVSTCSQTISLEDTTAPLFTDIPSDLFVGCAFIPPPFNVKAIDNCTSGNALSIDFEEIYGPGCPFEITRTWTASDACGNQSMYTQIIVVEVNTAPVVICPVDANVLCGESVHPSTTGFPLITESCTPVTINFTDDYSNQTGCSGYIFRVFEIIDECGNAVLCTQKINIVDIGCEFNSEIEITEVECGDTNGEISIDPIQGFTYTWSNGQSGPEIVNLEAGTYTVTIINADLSCSEVIDITLDQEQVYTLFVTNITNPSLPGFNDGSVDLLVPNLDINFPLTIILNGVPYGNTYSSVFSITNLSAGVYTIQIIDNNGCPSNALVVELIDGSGIADSKQNNNWFVSLNSPELRITDWNQLHKESFTDVRRLELLNSLVEHPETSNSPIQNYSPGYNTTLSGGKVLNKNLHLKLGIGQFTGSSLNEYNYNTPNSFKLESRFTGLQALTGLVGKFQSKYITFYSGIDMIWKNLSVANSLLISDNQNILIPDAYSFKSINTGLSAGIQFTIGERIDIHMQVQTIIQSKSNEANREFFLNKGDYILDLILKL